MPLPYCYEHPRPAVTVDVVACAFDGADVRVLLVRRGAEPHEGQWALPGGFMEIGERLHEAALRELEEETGLDAVQELHMLGIFDAVKRDPRGRVLSVAFGALLRWPLEVAGNDDAREAAWVRTKEAEDLAFDHDEILERGLRWLSISVLAGTGGMLLLPESFSTQQAKKLFRALEFPSSGVTHWLERLRTEGMISTADPPKKSSRPRSRPTKKSQKL